MSKTAPKYPPHPAAELFPMMQQAELEQLAADIKRRGLLHALLVYDGKLLDGRNREAACRLAGVEPRYEVLRECESPVGRVVAENLLRRQLTQAEKASIAVEIEHLYKAEAKAAQRQGGQDAGKGRPKQVDPKMDQPIEKPYHRQALSKAAAAVGVARTSVYDMREIKKKAPDVFEAAKRGEFKTVAEAKRAAGMNGSPTAAPTSRERKSPLRGLVKSVAALRWDLKSTRQALDERLARTSGTQRAELVNELRELSKTTATLIRAVNAYRSKEATGARA